VVAVGYLLFGGALCFDREKADLSSSPGEPGAFTLIFGALGAPDASLCEALGRDDSNLCWDQARNWPW